MVRNLFCFSGHTLSYQASRLTVARPSATHALQLFETSGILQWHHRQNSADAGQVLEAKKLQADLPQRAESLVLQGGDE